MSEIQWCGIQVCTSCIYPTKAWKVTAPTVTRLQSKVTCASPHRNESGKTKKPNSKEMLPWAQGLMERNDRSWLKCCQHFKSGQGMILPSKMKTGRIKARKLILRWVWVSPSSFLKSCWPFLKAMIRTCLLSWLSNT